MPINASAARSATTERQSPNRWNFRPAERREGSIPRWACRWFRASACLRRQGRGCRWTLGWFMIRRAARREPVSEGPGCAEGWRGWWVQADRALRPRRFTTEVQTVRWHSISMRWAEPTQPAISACLRSHGPAVDHRLPAHRPKVHRLTVHRLTVHRPKVRRPKVRRPATPRLAVHRPHAGLPATVCWNPVGG